MKISVGGGTIKLNSKRPREGKDLVTNHHEGSKDKKFIVTW